MRRKLLLLVLLFPGVAASAQQRTWSLAECINYAIENNITVKQSAVSVEQKDIDLNTAEARRLPGLSANASQNWSFGRGLTADNTYENANTSNSYFSLGADVPLFNGFQISNSIKMARLDLKAAASDLERVKDDIRVAVAEAYLKILYSKEIAAVADSQVEIDAQQVNRLEAMAATGKASAAEVAAQKASLAQSQLTATQAYNDLNIAVLDLTQLLELEHPEGFDVAIPSMEAFQIKLLRKPEDVYERAIEIKPVIKSEEIRLEYAAQSIELAKGAFYPSLSLSGGLGTNFYTQSSRQSASFGEQMKNNFSQNLGLTLSIPIFSRFSTRNNVRSAKLNLANQELQLQNTKKTLYKEIQQLYYSAVAAQDKYKSCIFAKDSAEESFALMRAKYENGKAGITEFNESKNNLMRAESDLVQAQYEYLFQTRMLDFYSGEELVL